MNVKKIMKTSRMQKLIAAKLICTLALTSISVLFAQVAPTADQLKKLAEAGYESNPKS